MVDWLQISQVTGSSGTYTVTVTASSTSELTARTASLTVTAHAPAGGIWTDKTETISIRQKGTGELVVTPTVLNFVASGGSATIEITTYLGDWTITGSDWLSFSQTTGGTGQTTVTVTAPDYSSDRRRIGSISITDGYSTVNVNVSQWGVFSVVPNSFTFPASGGTESFTVSASRNWSITNIPAWITMSQVSGYNGTYTVTMTADENSINSRSGSFTVSDGYSTVNCNVSQAGQSVTDKYLTFDIVSGGTINWYGNDNYLRTIEYRINGGSWNSITSGSYPLPSFNVSTGDKVEFRGTYNYYGRNGFICGSFKDSTAKFNVSGNIMSLIDASDFDTKNNFTSDYVFYSLFKGSNVVSAAGLLLPSTGLTESCYNSMFEDCKSLTIAPTLPATTLSGSCYGSMFAGCSSLTTAPELPATTLAGNCYSSMFNECSSLTTAPTLPATSLLNKNGYNAVNCYMAMFMGCTSLTTAPSLPATSLTESCYNSMFYGCTSLTNAPTLPATTLAYYCYQGMFNGCSSLTTAPDLLATTLVNGCYYAMFVDTNLNYIKCLATDISATNCTDVWLSGVPSNGTFVKASGMNDWPRNYSGIPNNWTVQDA